MRKCYLFALLLIAGLVMMTIPVLAADTDIVISEVMYNAIETSESYHEWVEIYNKGSTGVSIGGWSICAINQNADPDEEACTEIISSMCPSGDCTIPVGAYWIIGYDSAHLDNELKNYYAPGVDNTKTISLSVSIGSNGLKNSGDYVALKNGSPQYVDCVSWGSADCPTTGYVSGGDWTDTTLSGAGNGQSITNVQRTWYYSKASAGTANKATPYATNEGYDSGDTVTAVSLNSFKVKQQLPTVLGTTLAVVGLAVGLTGVFLTRRRA